MLPKISNDDEFDLLVNNDDARAELFDTLARHTGQSLTPAPRGSAIVGLSPVSVVKMMAPHDAAYSKTEALCLNALEGKLPVETPRLEKVGTLDGWPYVQMTRLPGLELRDIWPTLDDNSKMSLATEVGELVSALHAIEAPAEIQRVDWPLWVSEKISSCEKAQVAKGADEHFVKGLADFLEKANTQQGRAAFLHTEIMLDHLLVIQKNSRWTLSGLFDFEPAWVAPVHYEFASIALFVAQGERRLLNEIMRAAGESISPERLLAMCMLHRYSNLKGYLERMGGAEAKSFSELAHIWFA